MIETIEIENYKSIERVVLNLGRTNVFIGENGAGKSNILEAVALAGAAQAGKLDNEFLTSRGIRVSNATLMRSAFNVSSASDPIKISTKVVSGVSFDYELTNDNEPYSSWHLSTTSEGGDFRVFLSSMRKHISNIKNEDVKAQFSKDFVEQLLREFDPKKIKKSKSDNAVKINLSFDIDVPKVDFDTGSIEDFIIYSPENSSLRVFEKEGQIQPLGINGEGLIKLLRVMAKNRDFDALDTIKESLTLFSWFKDFRITSGRLLDRMIIYDRYLDVNTRGFDQRSANEGFLYVAFYLTLFASKLTPKFFAIDNVDSSLNPKLCQALMSRLASLASEYGKQVLLTTHNPALLDGLDLDNPDNRLFVISRGPAGQTRVRRFSKKSSDGPPRRLSELFLSGALGGLPKGF